MPRCKKLTRKHVEEAKRIFASDEYAAMSWKPTDGFSPREFRQLAEAAIPDGYGEFNAGRVGRIVERSAPSSCVTLTREYSPAIYVRGPRSELQKIAKARRSLRADEVDFRPDGSLRLWWD
jgi:hypothetical protein